MVVDHTSQIDFPPCNRGILVVCAPRDDTRRTRIRNSLTARRRPGGKRLLRQWSWSEQVVRLATVKSAKQLPNASDQSLNRERFHQVLDVVLGQEKGDSCIGGEPGNENEAIGQ